MRPSTRCSRRRRPSRRRNRAGRRQRRDRLEARPLPRSCFPFASRCGEWFDVYLGDQLAGHTVFEHGDRSMAVALGELFPDGAYHRDMATENIDFTVRLGDMSIRCAGVGSRIASKKRVRSKSRPSASRVRPMASCFQSARTSAAANGSNRNRASRCRVGFPKRKRRPLRSAVSK